MMKSLFYWSNRWVCCAKSLNCVIDRPEFETWKLCQSTAYFFAWRTKELYSVITRNLTPNLIITTPFACTNIIEAKFKWNKCLPKLLEQNCTQMISIRLTRSKESSSSPSLTISSGFCCFLEKKTNIYICHSDAHPTYKFSLIHIIPPKS